MHQTHIAIFIIGLMFKTAQKLIKTQSKLNVSFKFKTVLLVGGEGKRLKTITKGKIPKSFVTIDKKGKVRGIDYWHMVFSSLGIKDVILSTFNFTKEYQAFIKEKKAYEIFVQTNNSGTYGALEEIINYYGESYQYLVITGDTYMKPSDILKILQAHKIGTISWGITPLKHQLMESYHGLVVHNNAKTILGDVNDPRWKKWSYPELSLFVKGGINVIDPKILKDTVKRSKNLSQNNSIDLYWDVMPVIEDHNRQRFFKKLPSLLQGVLLDQPVIDYGTPERLELTRSIFDEKMEAKND